MQLFKSWLGNLPESCCRWKHSNVPALNLNRKVYSDVKTNSTNPTADKTNFARHSTATKRHAPWLYDDAKTTFSNFPPTQTHQINQQKFDVNVESRLMRKRFSEIKKCRLFSSNGVVGNVTDLLIDDELWDIRYLVVDAGKTLVKRRFLISPAAIEDWDFENDTIQTSLGWQQVIDGPGLDSNQPISRQYEEALVNHYGWPIYWLGRDVQISPEQIKSMANDEATSFLNEENTTCLRSAAELCGYNIQTNDGPTDSMKDLIINLNAWTIEHGTVNSRELPSSDSLFSTN